MSFISRDNAGWWFGLSVICFVNGFYQINFLVNIGIIIIVKSLTEMLNTWRSK